MTFPDLDTSELEPKPAESVPRSLWAQIPKYGQWMIYATAAVLVLSIVQQLAGTSELTSRGTVGAALRLAVPIMLAGLGGLFSERSGVVNIGLEGMMIAGTWFGAWAGWSYGPWQGVLFGMAGGALFGLIHALATVTFAVDHIVSGVAINILALGGMRFLSQITYTPDTGGGVTQSPRIQSSIGTFDVLFLSDFFVWLEGKEIFLLSDASGLLGGFTTGMSWLTFLALLIVPATWWLLWRTAWGLRLRSCGENPYAAESLGVPVLRMKYYAVVISGALAGLGGAYLVVVQAGIYREAQVAGRGFIGLAALIFGNWFPGGVFAGAALFGFSDALRLRQESAIVALLLLIAIILFTMAVRSLIKGGYAQAGIQAAVAVGFVLWYAYVRYGSGSVPNELVFMTPYLVTLLVLSLATQRLRMPAADGLRYRKGEAI